MHLKTSLYLKLYEASQMICTSPSSTPPSMKAHNLLNFQGRRLYLDGMSIPWPMNGLNISRRKPSLVIPNVYGITTYYGLPLPTSNIQCTLELIKALVLLLGLNLHYLQQYIHDL